MFPVASRMWVASLAAFCAALWLSGSAPGEAQEGGGLPWLPAAMKEVLTLRVIDRYGDAISLGTAFAVPGGLAVTNAHVLRGASGMEMLDSEGNSIGRVREYLRADSVLDLALLQIPGKPRGGLRLSEADAAVGDYVMAIGAPLGLSQSVSDGIASGLRQVDGAPRLQVTAPISPGSSGGPIVSRSGKVVGVAVESLVAGQNLNFAVPVSTLREFLQGSRVATALDEFRFARSFDPVIPFPIVSSAKGPIPRLAVGGTATYSFDEEAFLFLVHGRAFEEIQVQISPNESLLGWKIVGLLGEESLILRDFRKPGRDLLESSFILPANGEAMIQLTRDGSAGRSPANAKVAVQALTAQESTRSKAVLSRDTDEGWHFIVNVTNGAERQAKSFSLGQRVVRVSADFAFVNFASGASSLQEDEIQFDCETREFKISSRARSEFDGTKAKIVDTSGENFRFGMIKTFRPVDADEAMPLLGHYVCGMWGPK